MSKRVRAEPPAKPAPPKLAIAIPCSRVVDIEWVMELMHWISARKDGGMTALEFFPQAGRIDWGRSVGIDWARNLGVDVCFQLDTDNYPTQPIEKILELVAESFKAGVDIVCAPSVAYNAALMIRAKPDGSPPTGKAPFDVEGSAFGFVAFSKKALAELAPVDFIHNVEGMRYPLYGISTSTSEDYSLCQNWTSHGGRVAIDPRLYFGHGKRVKLLPVFEDAAPEERPTLPIPGFMEVRLTLERKGLPDKPPEATPPAPAP